MYGKIIDGRMTRSPLTLVHENKTYINPADDVLAAAGYVPLSFTPPPVGDYKELWTIVNGIGVQSWELIPEDPNREATPEQRMQAQIMYTALMTNTLLDTQTEEV